MPDITGRLLPARNGRDEDWCFEFRNTKGEPKKQPLASGALVGSLRSQASALVGTDVAVVARFDSNRINARSTPIAAWLESEGGNEAAIEELMEAKVAAHEAERQEKVRAQRAARATVRAAKDEQAAQHKDVIVSNDRFINPYAFVGLRERDPNHKKLGDAPQVSHNRWHDDRWSGRISFKLTTVTPLLVLDEGEHRPEAPAEHRQYEALQDKNGKPILPGSVIKGALSARYEAITQSRLRVFSKENSERPWRRMRAEEGAHKVPAIIRQGGKLELFRGMEDTSMHAAWLPYYSGIFWNVVPPSHGARILAEVELHEKRQWRRDRWTNDFEWKTLFSYWRVRRWVKSDGKKQSSDAEKAAQIGPNHRAELPHNPSPNQTAHIRLGTKAYIEGTVVITGRNAARKHDERVFFHKPGMGAPSAEPLSEMQHKSWLGVLRNYNHQGKSPPPAPDGEAALESSLHVTADYLSITEDDFASDQFCYAELDASGAVSRLIPVPIARAQHEDSPLTLLPATFRKMASNNECSPADRVFGFVAEEGEKKNTGNGPRTHARRSQLRVHEVDSSKARIERPQAGPVALAVLGTPRRYGRFSLVEVPKGSEAQPLTANRQDWYSASRSQQLAGRKFYWTHRDLPPDYWTSDSRERVDKSNHYREFVHPGPKTVTKFNRAVCSWIAPKSEFRITLDVMNLSAVEVGALLWLLDDRSKKSVQHNMGYGKPLGFGATHWALDLEGSALQKGKLVGESYSDLAAPAFVQSASLDVATLDHLIDSFRDAGTAAWKCDDIEEAPHVAEFLAIARGPQATEGHAFAVRYPRITPQPGAEDGDGSGYEWFVTNEGRNGKKHALDRPTSTDALPHDPAQQ